MLAYVDCLACSYLIRATEPSCPFCGVSRRHAPAPPSRLLLGLTLGLGLSMFGCGDKDDKDDAADTVVDPTNEADAVTYAGPDPWTDTETDSGVGTTIGGTTVHDPSDTLDADAVTYAGPDETTSLGGETFSATDSGTTAGDTDGTMSDTDTGSSSSN